MLNFFDFEVFEYDWLVVIINPAERAETVIVNNVEQLREYYESHKQDVWVGYNSAHYDQFILKALLCGFNPKEVSDYIIRDGKSGWSFSSLFRTITINNFDISDRVDRGLKSLEGFMGNNIKESEISFDIDRRLTDEEIQETIEYCRHDVEQTMEVFIRRKSEFDARLGLVRMFNLPLSYINKSKAQLCAIILGATRRSYSDEFDISIPPTLKVEKYKHIVDWYKDPSNYDYSKSLEVEVAGITHTFAWGGLHSAIPKYSSEGIFINMDVTSYYPSLMIRYDLISRSVKDPKKFKEIYDLRVKYKAAKDSRQLPLKFAINGTYGACKDKNNALFDPRQANNVCVYGQLLLLDLIEKLEPYCQIIQSNTDGILVKIDKIEDYDLIDDIAYEWEMRTGMGLEFELYKRIFQKDVNNYLLVDMENNYKSKGAYVKKLDDLSYDLPIVNKAMVDYMTKNIPVEVTINNCFELKQFQKIVKVSGKYLYAVHGQRVLSDKTLRVFASTRSTDGGVAKLKSLDKNPEKFANTPERCFIDNGDINGKSTPEYLDRQWYIDLTYERLRQFGVL